MELVAVTLNALLEIADLFRNVTVSALNVTVLTGAKTAAATLIAPPGAATEIDLELKLLFRLTVVASDILIEVIPDAFVG